MAVGLGLSFASHGPREIKAVKEYDRSDRSDGLIRD